MKKRPRELTHRDRDSYTRESTQQALVLIHVRLLSFNTVKISRYTWSSPPVVRTIEQLLAGSSSWHHDSVRSNSPRDQNLIGRPMRLYLQLASDAQLRQTGTATLALITKSEIVLDTANHWPYGSSGTIIGTDLRIQSIA